MEWSDKRAREVLPIDSQLDNILKLLEKHQVLICAAETGAGKTTRIPQAALLSNPTLNILMTQPRRSACRWIGKRIAAELGCQPGQTVGWRLFGEEPKISEKTRLELMVDQALINRIRHDGVLPHGLIIIDEAHERSLSIDLLLGLIKEKFKDAPNTQVLITSATIDTQKFSNFFNNAPIVEVKGRCFPVIENIFQLHHGEHHTEGAARAASHVLNEFLQHRLVIPDAHQTQKVVEKGTVIVLLPGKEDIQSVVRKLFTEVKHNNAIKQIQVLSCHSNSSSEDQDKVQDAVPSNTLRFVCSTELLRTSVTLPETIGVIDSLQIKRLITNNNGVACLDKISISRAEANQAKGRAGRTGPGFYMPISFGSEYHALAEWPQPAILREPVTHIALQVAAIERSIRDFSFIDTPPQDKIELATSRLKAIAALTPKEEITETGKSLLQFPLDPELAMILLTADKLQVLAEAIIVTASLEDISIFSPGKANDTVLVDKLLLQEILGEDNRLSELPDWVLRQEENFEVQCGHPNFPRSHGAHWLRDFFRKTWAGKSGSDFTALVNAYRAFRVEEQQLKKANTGSKRTVYKAHEKYLNDWCFARGLHLKNIRSAEDKMLQIKESLARSPIKLVFELDKNRDFDEAALTKAIISGKVDHIAYRQYGNNEFSSKLGSFELDYGSACPKNSDSVLASSLRKVHVPGKGRRPPSQRSIATYAAPIETTWLQEILPQFCSQQRLDDCHYDPIKDLVVVTEVIYFNGDKSLSTKQVPVEDKQATQIIAEWLAMHCSQSRLEFRSVNDELNNAFKHNLMQQKLAKYVYERAGQQYCKIYSTEEWVELFVKLLSNVTRLRDLTSQQIKAIYLPELDPDLLEQINLNNPLSTRITGIKRQLNVEYRGSLPPLLTVEEEQIESWLKFLEQRPQFPGGRNMEVKVLRKNFTGNACLISWDSQGRADLSNFNITNLTFYNGNLFTDFIPTEQELDKLPVFLPNNVFINEKILIQQLNKFCNYLIDPTQLKYIQWSITAQVIRKSKELKTTSYLEVLQAHELMKKENYFAKFSDAIDSTLSLLIKSFWGKPNTQQLPHAMNLNQKIEEAIESIAQAISAERAGVIFWR